MDALNENIGVSVEAFIQNYIWEESYVIYEQAIYECKLLREAEK